MAHPGFGAVEIAEYFNNYGSATSLNTKGGAGGGWLSQWSASPLPSYQSGSQLGYGAPGFSNGANEYDPHTDGLAHSGAPGAFHLPNPLGVNSDSVAVRSFAGLTGTIWISAVTIVDTGFPIIGDGEGTILWLEPNSSGVGGANYVGIRSDVGSVSGMPEPVARTAGVLDDADNTVIRRGPPTLMLARVRIDADGAFDTLDFWVNPNLQTNLAGLDSQVLYRKLGEDLFGPSLDSIGISFGAGLNLIDSIRLSDSLNGVGVSLLVPEHSGATMLGVLACMGWLTTFRFHWSQRTAASSQ